MRHGWEDSLLVSQSHDRLCGVLPMHHIGFLIQHLGNKLSMKPLWSQQYLWPLRRRWQGDAIQPSMGTMWRAKNDNRADRKQNKQTKNPKQTKKTVIKTLLPLLVCKKTTTRSKWKFGLDEMGIPMGNVCFQFCILHNDLDLILFCFSQKKKKKKKKKIFISKLKQKF